MEWTKSAWICTDVSTKRGILMLRIFYGELDTPEYIFNPDPFFTILI